MSNSTTHCFLSETLVTVLLFVLSRKAYRGVLGLAVFSSFALREYEYLLDGILTKVREAFSVDGVSFSQSV